MEEQSSILTIISSLLSGLNGFLWSYILVLALPLAGVIFLIKSRFLPFRYFMHAINVLRGKYDNPDDPGQISHFQALSSALAATVGMGNIAGVALAISTGGPGALFWMWFIAFLGIATKYFTCTLAVMFRGNDAYGELQGGPMYVIREGLGKNWKWLGIMFSLAGMIGCLPIFQANQLTEGIEYLILIPNGITTAGDITVKWIIGGVLLMLVAVIILGGIKRIGSIAAQMVPAMVVLYFLAVFTIMVLNIENLPATLWLIVTDAFTAQAVLGGAFGSLFIIGLKRAAFSNEAGIGTAPMAHGAAKTTEPVREGLVAMLGPAIDTLIVCTLTAVAILITGVWQDTSLLEQYSDLEENTQGILLTGSAFKHAFGASGGYILMVCVSIFAVTSLFSYSYYGAKCANYLFADLVQKWGWKVKPGLIYNIFYAVTIIFGAVAKMTTVVTIIEIAFAIMAIPTLVSTVALMNHVMQASRKYFGKLDQQEG